MKQKQKSPNVYLERIAKVLDERKRNLELIINQLGEIKPMFIASSKEDSGDDERLSSLIQAFIGKLIEATHRDLDRSYVSVGEKLLIIEKFLVEYTMSFPEGSSAYSEEAELMLDNLFQEVSEIMGMPKEAIDQAWLHIVP